MHANSACAIQDACRPVCQTVRVLNFSRDLTPFEVLHILQAVDPILRFCAEWVVHLMLPQVGFQRFSIWMRFELMNQLVDHFFACMVFLFNCRVWLSLNSVITFRKHIALIRTATSFPVLARIDAGLTLDRI